MPLGYKYVERDADSQINYFDLGQQAVGMLQDWQQGREEKKEAYRQDYRESLNNLMDAPQGENQDANFFINNYAHDAINQKKIDYDLLTRGQISQREYTLKSQNQIDGTKQLFEIQKLYQDNYATAMKGIQDGTLQSGINIFNMGMVEGYGDFNNSKATINPKDGTVGIGLMETKIVDGKPVRVLSQNIAPVNVIRGKILQKVPTFDVDNKTTSFVKNLGEIKSAVYSAATTLKAGTITELTGIEFVKSIKDPATKAIVGKFNQAIDDQVGSYFSNPYNLTSVLTENLGTYNADSFTFDKDLADKDDKKILVKIDPTTQMTTLDPKGPNYEAQKKQATDYVRNQIISKLDEEKKVSTTGQLEESSATKLANEAKYRPRTADENKRNDEKESAKDIALQIRNLTVGDENSATNALPYFQAMLEAKGQTIDRRKDGIYITTETGEEIPFVFNKNGVPANPLALQKQLVSALKDEKINGQLVNEALDSFYSPKQKLNIKTEGKGYSNKRDIKNEFLEKIKINPELFNKKDSKVTTSTLAKYFKGIDGLTFKDVGGLARNDIKVFFKGKEIVALNSKEKANAQAEVSRLRTALDTNLSDEDKLKLLGPATSKKSTNDPLNLGL